MIQTREILTDPQGLPEPGAAAFLYTGSEDEWLATMFQDSLLAPAVDMAQRPSKKIRARLVQLGFMTISGPSLDPEMDSKIALASQAIELLHTGSLMIDDIQDQSTSRRGAPAAHEKFGTSATITVGNWLYFWPLRLLERLKVTDSVREALRSQYLHALEKAHMGQALDLRIRMDKISEDRWEQIVETTLQLKTASITELAMTWGATMAGAAQDDIQKIGKLGFMFGTLLQKLDDLGNLFPAQNLDKLYEDVTGRKPSWIWVLASHLGLATDLLTIAGDLPTLNQWPGKQAIRDEGIRQMETYWLDLEAVAHDIDDRSKIMSQSLRQLKDKLYADYFAI